MLVKYQGERRWKMNGRYQPEYRMIKNQPYRKLPEDEVKYYINEIHRLIIKDNVFWLELSSLDKAIINKQAIKVAFKTIIPILSIFVYMIVMSLLCKYFIIPSFGEYAHQVIFLLGLIGFCSCTFGYLIAKMHSKIRNTKVKKKRGNNDA